MATTTRVALAALLATGSLLVHGADEPAANDPDIESRIRALEQELQSLKQML